ncbi:MAG: DUF1059 domain-containing protein [Armatimonadetes bacterium]|nr:DUF1059 domain-containing protein [Armatimonadota bacterium]
MKMVTCPCGFEAKTHSADELVKLVQVHVQEVHKQDYPQGITREQVMSMVKDV